MPKGDIPHSDPTMRYMILSSLCNVDSSATFCRRSSAETSISGRGMESNAWEGSRLGPSHSKRQSRPAQLRNLNSQLSSKLSDSIGVHASSDQGFMQATPRSRPVRNSFSIESRLRAGELPVDLLRQKSQRESLLDLLKQRAGSQELSSQVCQSIASMLYGVQMPSFQMEV